jgi:hypothetical protein
MILKNKYLDLLLQYFKINDDERLFVNIKRDLNDRELILYHYDDDLSIRLKNLFQIFFEKYIEFIGSNYHALWNLIHLIPLIVEKDCLFKIENFYFSFVVDTIDCSTCVSHYIYSLNNLDKSIFEDSDKTFEYFVNLHNIINENNNKDTISLENIKQYYSNYLI